MAVCYDCGIELTAETKTKEHVPAKALYEGLGEEYKVNRITVPACIACNNLYSAIDQEIRDVIAIRCDGEESKKDFMSKGFRSITRQANWKDRTYTDEEGNVTAVTFSYAQLRQIHIKNFKALFFRRYGFPVPHQFDIEIMADGGDQPIEAVMFLHDYARKEKEWEVSGHPDIFKFILKDITPNDGNLIYESQNFDLIVAVVGLLVYHDDVAAVVVAGKKDFIESCKPKN